MFRLDMPVATSRPARIAEPAMIEARIGWPVLTSCGGVVSAKTLGITKVCWSWSQTDWLTPPLTLSKLSSLTSSVSKTPQAVTVFTTLLNWFEGIEYWAV